MGSDFSGTVGVLNVGAGDTKLVFDKTNPAECIRAGRIVKDMIRRGYALLVEVERNGVKKFERARDFDPETSEYIIADFDPVEAERAGEEEANGSVAAAAPAGGGGDEEGGAPRLKRGGKPRDLRVPAAETRSVAVARSAGG